MSEDNSEHEITINPKRVLATDVLEHRSKEFLEPMPSVAEVFAEGGMYENNEYLSTVLDDLPDHRITEASQQRDYAMNKASMKGLEAAAKAGSAQHIADYIKTHPEAEHLGLVFSVRAYVKKSTPINYKLVFTHMLDCILDRSASLTTQKAILDSVKKSTSIRDLSANIWNMQLKNFVKTALRDRLKAHGVQIALASCRDMSEVRKAIDNYYAKRQAVHKLKLDITVTPNEIIVNDTSYKIILRESGVYKYKSIRLQIGEKRPWLNVDELKVLFGLAV